jgi:chromosome segregation ATPase
MNSIDYSTIINILLIIAFIVDRIFRLKSVKEYKEAKEAQIENLKQQIETERKNNDIELTEMHKKRYESLKVLFQERETQINNYHAALLELQSSLASANKEIDLKAQLTQTLIVELNRLERYKHDWEIEKRLLLTK